MAMDKDTWIAENLIPKNAVRRPRLNVKSVDVFTATRKTKFTLCILGSWAIYMPPYNLARLSSLVRESGYYTNVYDFNVDSHYALKEANPALDDAWNGANYWWWQDEKEYHARIHPTYEPILKTYLETLINDDVDIIGFSTYYTNFIATTWMISEIKKVRPDITILMGGPQCHEAAFKVPPGVDYYFIGESEQNILDFLNNWEQGIKPTQQAIGSLYSDTRIDIDSLPYPDYTDFDLDKYWGKGSVCAEISRGCIAKCSYCTEVYYWKFRDRGATTVVDELEYQVKKYGISFVSFVDSLMNGNLKEFKKFCEEIVKRELGINWWGYARCDGRMDLEFYQLLADAGCQGFNYGIETGSDKVLKAINKKNTVAEINQNLIDSHKVGMKVSACWVIGAPGEDIEAFTHSFNMLWNHRKRIYAVSPGPGLGDNMGSAYDDREKYNINPRNKPWLGAWYTLDLTNTKLHRQIRIKLMHIWLHICKEYGGALTNVHSIGDITEHFDLKFDSEYINDHVEYEDFDFNIIKSGHGAFADSVMNEVFGFLRMLWRVRGGFEITINFNKELDHKDFIFSIDPATNSFDANINFKIDDLGNYQTFSTFKFVNNFKDVVNIDGFDYTFNSTGKWNESDKTKVKKVFFIKQAAIDTGALPLAACFSSIAVSERLFLSSISKMLSPGSIVVDVDSRLGGRAAIFAHANTEIQIYSIESFNPSVLKNEFDSMSSWVREQLVDLCKTVGERIELAYEHLDGITSAFEADPSGKAAWEQNTSKFKNIKLHNGSIDTNLCLLKNPTEDNVDTWLPKILPNGYLVVHSHSMSEEVDQHIRLSCKLVKQVDDLMLFQKL
jgi:anaerobic magnesium-protoporphyrin IX monomethyl ester cyclase